MGPYATSSRSSGPADTRPSPDVSTLSTPKPIAIPPMALDGAFRSCPPASRRVGSVTSSVPLVVVPAASTSPSTASTTRARCSFFAAIPITAASRSGASSSVMLVLALVGVGVGVGVSVGVGVGVSVGAGAGVGGGEPASASSCACASVVAVTTTANATPTTTDRRMTALYRTIAGMIPVTVTATVGRKTVPLPEVRDPRIRRGLEDAAHSIGRALATVVCPKHRVGPKDVRLHFDANGNGDFKYESCCEVLGKLVQTALG